MDSGIDWGPILVVWVILGFIGMAIGSTKGKPGAGFALGILLGPIGLIVAALLTPTPEVEAERLAEVAHASASRNQTPVTTQTDRLSNLERLQTLREQGVLTEEEFNDEKARILAGEQTVGRNPLPAPHMSDARADRAAAQIQRLLDERGLNAPGAAGALAPLMPEVQAVALLGPSGDDGVIAVYQDEAALWWSDGRQAVQIDLRTVDLVERDGRVVTLHRPGKQPILILAGNNNFARGWLRYMKRFGCEIRG